MKSKISHYFASMTLLSGFILALMGIGFALSVNLTRRSDPGEIAITYAFIGFGLSLILTGINLMIKHPKEYHYYVVASGLILSWVGIGAFYLLFPVKGGWVYPNVTYVAVAYTAGTCLLSGNAFANTVLIQIDERARLLFESKSKKVEEKAKEYSEDEIEKEVQKTLDRALSESDGFSSFNLGIKDKDYDFILGKAFQESAEKKTTFMDDISEVDDLKIAHSGKLEVNDDGLDAASMLLSKAINDDSAVTNSAVKNTQKKGIYYKSMNIFKRHKNG